MPDTLDPLAPDTPAIARDVLVGAAHAAGEIALRFFQHGAKTRATVETKEGGSPVTEADILCDRYLEKQLRRRFPQAAWLSEEIADDLVRLGHRVVLIVDPIDGTRGFVAGDPRWTVCIALVVDGRPVASVVRAPALDETYAAALGVGATLNGAPLQPSARAALAGARAAGPKPIARALENTGVPLDLVPKVPSLAYRLVCVASGALDIAFTSGDARDWDIAAADLIVHEAGARLAGLDGTTPRYNAADPIHGRLIVAPSATFAALQDAVARGMAAAGSNI